MQALIDRVKALWDVITGFFPWLYNVIKAIFQALWVMLGDFFLWIFESILDLVKTIIQSIPVNASTFDASSYLSGAGADLMNMLGAIRVPEAIGLIITALGIRLLLQLIPFTRLGS